MDDDLLKIRSSKVVDICLGKVIADCHNHTNIKELVYQLDIWLGDVISDCCLLMAFGID